MTRFMVDPVKCIGCEACNNSFPKAFKFDRPANVAFTDTPVPSAEYNNEEVVGVCPTSAIYVVGAPPPTPEEIAAKEANAKEHIADLQKRSRTIEHRIEDYKRSIREHGEPLLAEDPRERDRRYGLVFRVEETPSSYVVVLDLPRRIPDSHVRRRLGLGFEMPPYEVAVRALDADAIEIHGADGRHSPEAGLRDSTASFPPQFLVHPLPGPSGLPAEIAERVLTSP